MPHSLATQKQLLSSLQALKQHRWKTVCGDALHYTELVWNAALSCCCLSWAAMSLTAGSSTATMKFLSGAAPGYVQLTTYIAAATCLRQPCPILQVKVLLESHEVQWEAVQ